MSINLPGFFLLALCGISLLSLLTGPLGCLLVWRRMSFFGDALSHAALLGVAMGLFLKLPVTLCVMLTGGLFALLLALMQKGDLANDTLLAILSPTALALGLLALTLMPGVRVDLSGYLFGDILALTRGDVVLLALGSALGGGLLIHQWKKLLAMVTARDLAIVEGYKVRQLELLLLVLTAMVIAAGVQLVGVLLLTALLIIPAATARKFARTPGEMAVLATLVSLLAGLVGLFASLYADAPAGPAIVVAAAVFFLLSRAVKKH